MFTMRSTAARGLAFASLAVAALIGTGRMPAAAEEPPATIVIFDGSGSMWGKIVGDKEAKFYVTRDALRRALAKINPATRVGLAAFGHRRKADCSDTELILTPEPLDSQRVMAPLEKFNPKGKGPLVTALKETAGKFASLTGPASIILLHDDLDNCQQDACAAAEELAKSNPKLAVHVISIGLKMDDIPRMACVPRITGGRHFDVQDAAALGSAFEDALSLASVEIKPQPAPVAAAATVRAVKPTPPLPQPPVEDNGPSALKMTATLGAGGPAVIVPLDWKVMRASDRTLVATARTASFDLSLPADSYVVEIAHGLVSARETIEVKPKGATRAVIAITAGAVRVSAVLQKSTPPLDQAVFSISDVPGGTVAPRTVWTGGADAPPIFLPVGTWRVSAEVDRVRVERQVSITAGNLLDAALILDAGRLRVKAADREGGAAPDNLTFRVTEDDADSPGGRREIARSTAASPEFTLPAGTYYISARHGQAEVRERVLVNAGDDVSRTLVIPLARLALQSRVAGASLITEPGVAYTIDRLDGAQDQIRSRLASPKLDLPAGTYRIVSQLGGQNARISRDIEIKTGTLTTLNFDHLAANIQLKISGSGPRAAAGEVLWDVRDAQDRSVWQTVQGEPRAFLAAGRYKIVAEGRNKRGRLDFEVKAGETRTVEVPLE